MSESEKEKKDDIKVGTNICFKCRKIVYIPSDEMCELIENMPHLKECPYCGDKRILIITEIVSDKTAYYLN